MLGSLRVHCRRVPAGRTMSRALALKEKTDRPSVETARAAYNRRDFIEFTSIDRLLIRRPRDSPLRDGWNLITEFRAGSIRFWAEPASGQGMRRFGGWKRSPGRIRPGLVCVDAQVDLSLKSSLRFAGRTNASALRDSRGGNLFGASTIFFRFVAAPWVAKSGYAVLSA